jgi:hypothetical protein
MAMAALRRRVLALMAHNVPTWAGIVQPGRARAALGAAHIQITRHLPLAGCSLTELAQRAGITKQAMGKLVDQCAAWGLVVRQPDAHDARALPHPCSRPPALCGWRPTSGRCTQAEDRVPQAKSARRSPPSC